MFYATWLRSVALISGSKLAYMWPFVWVWTSELARTQLLAKKKTKQNSEVDLKTVIESTFDFQIDKRNHFSTDEFISSLATATRKKNNNKWNLIDPYFRSIWCGIYESGCQFLFIIPVTWLEFSSYHVCQRR